MTNFIPSAIYPTGVLVTPLFEEILHHPSHFEGRKQDLQGLRASQIDYLAQYCPSFALRVFPELVTPSRLAWLNENPATRPPGGPGTPSWEDITAKAFIVKK